MQNRSTTKLIAHSVVAKCQVGNFDMIHRISKRFLYKREKPK